MGGGKKKNKGLTPAKRKEAAKQSLKDRFKTEKDTRELFQTIEKVDKERQAIENAKKELAKWNEERDRLQKKKDELQNKNNDLMEVSKYKQYHPRIPLPDISFGDARKYVLKLKTFMDNLMCKDDIAQTTSKLWYFEFNSMLGRYQVVEDRLQLLQHRGKGRKGELKERKEKLEQQIKTLQLVFTNISKLDEKRQKENSHLTLEAYMDKRMADLNNKMFLLTKKIQIANGELKRVTEMVNGRQQQIQDLKATIKRKLISSVEESKEYKHVIETNKKLISQLNKLKENRRQIDDATTKIRDKFNEREEKKHELMEDEIKVQRDFGEFEKQMQHFVEDKTHRETMGELKQQHIAYQTILTNLRKENMELDRREREEKVITQIFKNQYEQIDDHNKCLIKRISNISHNMAKEAKRINTRLKPE